MSVIRAVEIGFGTLSFVESLDNGNPIIKTFTSIVAPADNGSRDLSGGLNKRNTIRVLVDGKYYEVGPDAGLLSNKGTTRVLNNSFTESHQFKALLLGALGLMNEPVIDVLGLGLPVDNFHMADAVKKAVKGEHVIEGKKVLIKDCLVLPQPYGGLISYANSIGQAGFNALRNKTILSIDPGYGTLDWITTKGLTFNDLRSDGRDMGFSTVLEAIAVSLKSVFPRMGLLPLSLIDEAFWLNKGILTVAGRSYPFPKCSGKDVNGESVDITFDVSSEIKYVTRAAISEVRNSARSGVDIELILLMGGPHAVYLDELREAYPDHTIVVVKNPLTAICEGLYIASVQYSQSRQKQKGAA